MPRRLHRHVQRRGSQTQYSPLVLGRINTKSRHGSDIRKRIVDVPSQYYPASLPKDCQLITEIPDFALSFQHPTADKQRKGDLSSGQVHAPRADLEAISYVFVHLGCVCGGYG